MGRSQTSRKRAWWRAGRTAAWLLALALAFSPAALAQEDGGAEADGAEGGGRRPVVMTILDDDAVMFIAKVDGRDLVRVIGRTRLEHGSRTVWTDELEYDEEAGTARMQGDVELVDEGEDGLSLTSQALRLDLNSEAATATGNVRFTRGEASGTADELYYGRYADLRSVIEAELAARPDAVRRAVGETLGAFLDDDDVLVLRGRVDMKDGEREFQSEFVVINTRDDALVSLGRSSARLPGPEN